MVNWSLQSYIIITYLLRLLLITYRLNNEKVTMGDFTLASQVNLVKVKSSFILISFLANPARKRTVHVLNINVMI